MRIKYRFLLTIAVVIGLPMAISTVVVSLVVRNQNDQEARARIETSLASVAYDLQVRADAMQRSLGEFSLDADVAHALETLIVPSPLSGRGGAQRDAANRLAAEMLKLTTAADIDHVALYDPDGRLLADLDVESGERKFAVYVRDARGQDIRRAKICRPRQDCRAVPWQSAPTAERPHLPAPALQAPPRVVVLGSLLGLQVTGSAGDGRQPPSYVAHKRFNAAYELDLSERVEAEVAFFAKWQAELMPMWNDPALSGVFLHGLPPDTVTHHTLELEQPYYAGFRTFNDDSGKLVGVVSARLPMHGTVVQTREAIAWLVGIGLLSILVALPVTLMLSRRFVRPIYELNAGVQAFAQGELAHRVRIPGHDEFGELAAAFNDMAEHIRSAQARLQELNAQLEEYNRDLEAKIAEATHALVVRNRQMQHDLNLAAEFQSAILPSMPRTTFLHCALRYLPYGGGVSGDVYDISLTRHGAVNLFLGDATGHGVASAIMTMMAQIGLDSLGPELPTDEVLRRLNALFATRERDMSITAVFLRITPQGRLTAANAGHPPTLIVPASGGEVIQLKDGGLPLGMFREELRPFVEVSYDLQPGDRVFTFTDGLTEWRNTQGDEFGEERLCGYLQESRGVSSLEDTLNDLIEQVRTFSGGTTCQDDLTVLAFRYEPR